MSRETIIVILMLIGIVNVAASVGLVVANFISPLSLRFNLSFLAVTCAFCAVNVSMFYGWL